MHARTVLVQPPTGHLPGDRRALTRRTGTHHDSLLGPHLRQGPLPRQPAQPGLFGDALGPGLLDLTSSLLSGDTQGALHQAGETGGAALSGMAQQGIGALGSAIGGPVGGVVSSLGGALGQGVGNVASGQSSVGEAAGGLGSAAQPALLGLLMSLLGR